MYIISYLSATCVDFAADERAQTLFGQFHTTFMD